MLVLSYLPCVISVYVPCSDIFFLLFLKITEAKDKTGGGLARDIVQCLQSNRLDLGKLAFQSYDFAAAMSGEFQGAQQKVTELVGHEVKYIACQAHRTNTAVEHSCHASPIIADLFNILEEIYVFFSSSTKRNQKLREKLQSVENSLGVKNLSKTRWTARAETIRAVNTSYEAIVDVLDDMASSSEVHGKSRTKALGLKKRVLSFDFILSLMFMKNILYKMKVLTECLESEELNAIDAVGLIQSTVKSLESVNADENAMNMLIQGARSFSITCGLDPETEFDCHHRPRNPSRRINDGCSAAVLTFETFYRRQFKLVLDTLIMRLKSNVQACMECIKPLYVIFQLPLAKSNLSMENLQSLVDMFPPSSRKPDVDALQAELEILFDQCSASAVKSMEDIMRKACEMKSLLKLSFRVAQLALTAGFSVASNERKFSLLKFIKNSLRTTMTDTRLDSLMLLASEKDLTDSVNFTEIVNSWSKLKNRRVKVRAGNGVESNANKFLVF